MDPSPQPTKPKPKPYIAIAVVAIPLVAILIAAVVTTRSSSDQSATATTLSQDGDPGAAGGAKGGGSASGTTATTTKGGDDESTTTKATTTTKPKANGVDNAEVPSNAADAGPEGDRATVTYPQPTVPASGCSTPSGKAVITLGSGPQPACLKLKADQPVVVRNRTGKEISFIAISVNEVIPAGSEAPLGTAGSAFGDGRSTFWSPGNPKLSGIVIVG